MIHGLLLAAVISGVAPATEPTPIEIQVPIFPEPAVEAQMRGHVSVMFEIASDGSVIAVHIVEGINPLLDAACLRSAALWAFETSDEPLRLAEWKFVFDLRVDSRVNTRSCPGPTEISICPPRTMIIRGWDRPYRVIQPEAGFEEVK